MEQGILMTNTQGKTSAKVTLDRELKALRRLAVQHVLLRRFISNHCAVPHTPVVLDPTEPMIDIMARLERLVKTKGDVERRHAA
jgi:hypothetical protein